MRYTAAHLTDMTMKQMQAHIAIEGLDVTVNKATTKAAVAKRILAAYAAKDVDAIKAGKASGEPVRPENPALEAACDSGQATSDDLPATAETERVENRGGPRPGAGRPKGMTSERARATNVSDVPNPTIQAACEMLFDAWATATGCPEIALTKTEAVDLALPWTNLAEYMGYDKYIPEWAAIGIACAWNTWAVVKGKAAIAKRAAKERRQVVKLPEVPSEPTS